MDPRLKHPFPMVVSGPTMCGKTSFVRKLLELGEEMNENSPEKIFWCYGEYQPVFEEMRRTISNIEFIEGLPSNMNDLLDPAVRNLIVIDDLMNDTGNRKEMTNLVTRGCHHRNTSLIHIQQNLFPKGKENRNISLNCHYICLFSNPRDRAQVSHLARQMCNTKQRRALLQAADNKLLKAICECVLNVLRGTVKLNPSQKGKLRRHKESLRQLADKRVPLSKKKNVLVQKGVKPVKRLWRNIRAGIVERKVKVKISTIPQQEEKQTRLGGGRIQPQQNVHG
ncbi:hypothetical protein AC249_AIPGENE9928 [Exaiptasia diaphana]|nr:hypothetical protein AC249_AIPGENE9928 [Exaiptasia diaphana]